jgi:hypothetical protein
MLLMSPEFDQVFATMAAVLFYLELRGLAVWRQAGWWGLGAGLLLAAGLYWSFGLWVLGGLVGFLALIHAFTGDGVTAGTPAIERRMAAAWWLAGLGSGTAVPWLLLWGLGGFDLPRVLRIAGEVHLGGITAYRPYEPWLVFNLVEFLQFVGLPLVVASLLTLAGGRHALNRYSLLFWGSVLALDLSGTARAEVGRLWLFLVPLALLGIYQATGRGQFQARHVAALLATQLAVGALMGGRWLTP